MGAMQTHGARATITAAAPGTYRCPLVTRQHARKQAHHSYEHLPATRESLRRARRG